MKRRSRQTPMRSGIALVATTALTSATMLLACLVIPLPAAARPLRMSGAPAVTVGSARSGTASRPEPQRAFARIAKAGAGEQPPSSEVATQAVPGGAAADGRVATGHRTWTPGEVRGCALARGQPRVDALM